MADDLERAAAQLRAELAQHESLLRVLDANVAHVKDDNLRATLDNLRADEAAAVERVRHDLGVVDQVIAERRGLATAPKSRTISVVYTQSDDTRAKKGQSRSRRRHPAQRRLYESGTTITAVAVEMDETRARVSSWMAGGEALRAIPRQRAEYLRARYGIPLRAWRRIQD